MSSDSPAPECYVYITLPGTTAPVTAGRFTLTADRRGTPIGRFVYGRSYLERPNAAELDPVELRLASRSYETRTRKGVFGALRDAGPDYWGRRIMEHQAGRPVLSELDYLLRATDDRAGALAFGLTRTPPAPAADSYQTLTKLTQIATSIGGARAKAVIEDDDALWIAKFNHPEDRWNYARVEHAMLLLARSCGMSTAQSRLAQVAGRDVLLVKRFDREKSAGGYRRARMVSAVTLLRTEETQASRDSWSYVALAEEVRRVCAEPAADAAELFRRMCFNALISNVDDRPRNHAVIANDRQWRLSPAYDLIPATPASSERRDLAMDCGDQGSAATAENLLTQSARFLLAREQAAAMLSMMEEQVRATWLAVARTAGVSERDCASISGAFVYPGFRRTRSAA